MQEYSVNHITSSPHYTQSNGLAEKFVQIVKKNLFYKAREEGTDLHKSLMIYHLNKQLTISNADVTKEVCQITTSNVKHC